MPSLARFACRLVFVEAFLPGLLASCLTLSPLAFALALNCPWELEKAFSIQCPSLAMRVLLTLRDVTHIRTRFWPQGGIARRKGRVPTWRHAPILCDVATVNPGVGLQIDHLDLRFADRCSVLLPKPIRHQQEKRGEGSTRKPLFSHG